MLSSRVFNKKLPQKDIESRPKFAVLIVGSLYKFCTLRIEVTCFLSWNSHTSRGFNPFVDLKISIMSVCKLLTFMLLLPFRVGNDSNDDSQSLMSNRKF